MREINKQGGPSGISAWGENGVDEIKDVKFVLSVNKNI